MIPIHLDRASRISLQEQLYRALRDSILDGRLEAGFALPPTRELAAHLGVSRNTVLQAYEWLTSEGLVDGRQGSGSYVSHLAATAVPFKRPSLTDGFTAAPSRVEFDFWYGRTDSRLFPLAFWRQTANKLLGSRSHGLADYGPAAGDVSLRQALVRHIAATRGIDATTEQVIITQGAQQALNLAARLVAAPKAAGIAMESPGYATAAKIFSCQGAKLAPVAVDESGIDISRAAAESVRAIYVTPSHQFPTGVTLSLERRRALIEWCHAKDAWLIEDDYDGEIVYDRPPLMAISAIDRRRSFYVGSFSKVLGSGLRIGYLVVPQDFSNMAAELKKLMSYGQSWLDQRILAEFLASGHFERHVRRLRKLYRLRRDNMLSLVGKWLGSGASYLAANSGAHIYCRFPECSQIRATQLAQQALANNLRIYADREAGIWTGNDDPVNALLIGYAAYTPEEATKAFSRILPVGR